MGEPPKKDYTPGWNDPPVLNYSPQNPPPKSRISNKRVAFPQEARGSAPIVPNLPPSLPNSNSCIESLYISASKNYLKILESVGNEKIKEDILQMLSAWQTGKFSEPIQNLLADISSRILERNSEKLNELVFKLSMSADSSTIKTYISSVKYVSELN
ncbi:uncharacterized protein LOC115882183 [Sitophilus oryzae]|uniref:Uncharacterized protein LOC115882183 n=1 Tax=Sitophilus oryzae TaxID=7048 RepID=A0A6J2XWP9_SITOR|nr:uncharacterized protein LOC115882183 [Sitophilus oryzae]